MMKRKLMIGSIAGLVALSGALGVGAASKSNVQPGGTNNESKVDIISTEEAKQIALDEFGGKLKSIELEKDDGMMIYDIELLSENKKDDIDIDIDIHAVTGEIIKVDRDDDDDFNDDFDDEYSDNNTHVKISLEEAIDIARRDTAGEVKEAQLDDDGYYEIEIKQGRTEVEFKVDAEHGQIIEKEIDND